MSARHYHHHYHFSYPTSFPRHFSFLALVSIGLALLLLLIFSFLYPAKPVVNLNQLSAGDLIRAGLATFYRLLVAYGFSLVLAIPLSLSVVSSPKLEKVLLPVFDILESVPVLAFFPLLVLIFIKVGFYDGAAIFVLFMAMLWNLVFSMVGGLKTIPQDIEYAAKVFGAGGWKKLSQVTLPAIFPYMVTGSILAWAQGWNIIIVAEVLHNYIPGGTSDQDLPGLGSLLVSASYQAKNTDFLVGLLLMILIIGTMNFFIWQRLLHLAQRYKFD